MWMKCGCNVDSIKKLAVILSETEKNSWCPGESCKTKSLNTSMLFSSANEYQNNACLSL